MAIRISIHAPIQGATCRPKFAAGLFRDFNSRAYTRRDYDCKHADGGVRNFNSRAYTRRDLYLGQLPLTHFDFNSRAYTRRDKQSK